MLVGSCRYYGSDISDRMIQQSATTAGRHSMNKQGYDNRIDSARTAPDSQRRSAFVRGSSVVLGVYAS
jgi:hypothetical protein